MLYTVAIDLKKLSLIKRNKIIDIVKSSSNYYKLENQIIEVDWKTAKVILREID